MGACLGRQGEDASRLAPNGGRPDASVHGGVDGVGDDAGRDGGVTVDGVVVEGDGMNGGGGGGGAAAGGAETAGTSSRHSSHASGSEHAHHHVTLAPPAALQPAEQDDPVLKLGLEGKLKPADFAKVKYVGRGAVGRVYLVEFVQTKKLYAMKVLSKAEMIQRNKVKRVLTEHEVLASTDHPLIVTLYASFRASDYLFFVMEFCEGGELFRILRRQPTKSLPESSARFYAAEVVSALEYLHRCGFMYRDLKPENLLLSAGGHIRLSDFDLSHAINTPEMLSSNAVMLGVDKCTSFVGTLEYVAPEMVQGTPHDSSVDWWTLGILLYEMMFGRTPFVARTMAEAFKNILACKVDFPSTPRVSGAAKDLIRSLLTRENRLGSQYGAQEIKDHPFFEGIDWDLVAAERLPAPYVPGPFQVDNFSVPKDTDPFDWTTLTEVAQPPADAGADSADAGRDDSFAQFSFPRKGNVSGAASALASSASARPPPRSSESGPRSGASHSRRSSSAPRTPARGESR